MKSILYITGLYDKQEYCQLERIRAFNEVQHEANEAGINIKVRTVVNNSGKHFAQRLTAMHKREAKFPYEIVDIGRKNYWVDLDHNGDPINEAGLGKNIFAARTYDLYRLLAEIFNAAMDQAVKEEFDYLSIQSGDQILPPNQATALVDFIDKHKDTGIVNGLVFYDYSKTTMNGREALKPMVHMNTQEEQNWLMANMLPNEQHGGLDHCEVAAIGTGGSLIPRHIFERLKFHTEFNGRGEDLRYCDEIRAMGYKVFIVPWLHIPNRYPNGEFY